MASIKDVITSPIKGKIGAIKRSSGYEYRDFYYKNASGKRVHVVGWHRAVDITTLGTVVAFARGKVVSVVKGITGQCENPSGGNSVTLLHADGCKTIYCHLDNGSNSHLNVGDIVEEGEKLGTDIIKTTGNSTGLHLHFAIYNPNETYQGSNYMNPIDYMQGKKVLNGYANKSSNSSSSAGNKFKIGNKVVINGSLYATSSSNKANGYVSNKTTTITRTSMGAKHPYNTTGDLGWMDEKDIKLVSNSSSNASNSNKTPTSNTSVASSLKVGDKVQIIANGNSMASGKGKTAGGKGYKMYITKIHVGRAYPYQVGNKGKTDSKNTTGFYKASALKKI